MLTAIPRQLYSLRPFAPASGVTLKELLLKVTCHEENISTQ